MAKRSFKWRKWIRWSLIALAIGFTPTIAIIVWRTWLISHPDARSSATPIEPIAEEQVESHTCGLHALRSLYAAYGIDPDPENLRSRLGADFYAVFWNHGTTGTFHADIYMVLSQDHFSVEATDPNSESGREELIDHVESGHLAMLLIERRQTGNLHWLLASDSGGGSLKIFDSLADAPYRERAEDFLEDYTVSALLIAPEENEPNRGSIAAHLLGAAEILKFSLRLGKSKGIQSQAQSLSSPK